MSILTVIRHGQASFMAANYDKLSPLGERQARLLGDYWIARGQIFDEVHYGPAERQIRTGELIGEMFAAAGMPWPKPVRHEALDEFPAEAIARKLMPELMVRHPHLGAWMAELHTTEDDSAKQRIFDRLLREVSQRWMTGEAAAPDIETWEDFCDRVERALRSITAAAPKSSRVAVFTSGGPTAATARLALGLTHAATLELTWSPRNASFSEFLFTSDRFSLSTFNATPHLTEPELLTYR